MTGGLKVCWVTSNAFGNHYSLIRASEHCPLTSGSRVLPVRRCWAAGFVPFGAPRSYTMIDFKVWLRRIFNRAATASRQARRRQRTARPRAELLEDRLTP